ncbi:MAG: SDR family oxidoreductase [Oscillospiraceae bacterium]|jgi:NAD(P)-dependent dehydrogenase (short-subunit alcohol dehydrogenase family)|nr:SDR family oxidoreductase [Oscillospiraceae bacterium]
MKFRYGKNVLVTGAGSGIGLSCAELFAGRGYTVFAASRRAAGETRAVKSGTVTPLSMDVTDESSIAAAAEKLRLLSAMPDIIIHCAGIGIGGAAEDTAAEAVFFQLDTNYFGVLNVNRAFMPHMREQGRGLVLIIGSVAGLIPVPYQSHYSSSKAALEPYCECLRIESRPFGVRVALIEPGDTKTDFTSARKMCVPKGSPYSETCGRSIEKMAKDEQNGKSPITVAKAAFRLSRRRNPPVRTIVGLDYKLLVFLAGILPSRLKERILTVMYAPKK